MAGAVAVDGLEGSDGWFVVHIAPAANCVVGSDRARTIAAGGDLLERACGGVGPPVCAASPASDRVVGSDPATVTEASGDVLEHGWHQIGRVEGVGLPVGVGGRGRVGRWCGVGLGWAAFRAVGVDGDGGLVLVAVQERDELGASERVVGRERGC